MSVGSMMTVAPSSDALAVALSTSSESEGDKPEGRLIRFVRALLMRAGKHFAVIRPVEQVIGVLRAHFDWRRGPAEERVVEGFGLVAVLGMQLIPCDGGGLGRMCSRFLLVFVMAAAPTSGAKSMLERMFARCQEGTFAEISARFPHFISSFAKHSVRQFETGVGTGRQGPVDRGRPSRLTTGEEEMG